MNQICVLVTVTMEHAMTCVGLELKLRVAFKPFKDETQSTVYKEPVRTAQ
jgi:hypothetical protein